MPIKIDGTNLSNIKVDGTDVKKVGVRGRPVFLKINTSASGELREENFNGMGVTQSDPFFESRSNTGVWRLSLSLSGQSTGAGVGDNIDFNTVVRMEAADETGYSYEEEFLIHIWGSDMEELKINITSGSGFDSGDRTINIKNGIKILELLPAYEGTKMGIKVLNDGSYSYIDFNSPKITWYVQGSSGSPKYTVYAYGDVATIYRLTYEIYEQELRFL